MRWMLQKVITKAACDTLPLLWTSEYTSFPFKYEIEMVSPARSNLVTRFTGLDDKIAKPEINTTFFMERCDNKFTHYFRKSNIRR